MKHIRIVALFAGLAADIVGTILLSIVIMIAFFVMRRGAGDSPQDVLQQLGSDTTFLMIGYLGGIAFTFIGAYVTARMSRPNSVLNALIFGIISTIFVLVFASMYPLWYDLLCVLTIIPISLVAGYSVAGKRSNQSMKPTAPLQSNLNLFVHDTLPWLISVSLDGEACEQPSDCE